MHFNPLLPLLLCLISALSVSATDNRLDYVLLAKARHSGKASPSSVGRFCKSWSAGCKKLSLAAKASQVGTVCEQVGRVGKQPELGLVCQWTPHGETMTTQETEQLAMYYVKAGVLKSVDDATATATTSATSTATATGKGKAKGKGKHETKSKTKSKSKSKHSHLHSHSTMTVSMSTTTTSSSASATSTA